MNRQAVAQCVKEVCNMATKSFLKNVRLHGRKESQAFSRALERSEEALTVQADPSTPRAKDMDKEAIRKIFGGKSDSK